MWSYPLNNVFQSAVYSKLLINDKQTKLSLAFQLTFMLWKYVKLYSYNEKQGLTAHMGEVMNELLEKDCTIS